MRLAIIGDRGIPARYSGFSTLVEQLAVRLVRDHSMDVTVYCRNQYYEDRPDSYEGVHCVYLPAPGGKSFESIVHSNLAMLHSLTRRFDVAFVVDPGNAPFSLPLKLRGVPSVFHTDGLGWKRQKWSPLQQRYYKWSEGVCASVATWLVTDSRAMQKYYEDEYGAPSSFIPYSGESEVPPAQEGLMKHGLQPRDYYLVVARMEPENNVDFIIDEYKRSNVRRPLVVVGGARFESEYASSVFARADDKVRCVGSTYDAGELNGLYANCYAYLHGHEVGGTNPSLLRAMQAPAACVPIDVVFHREVLGDEALYFEKRTGGLTELLEQLEADESRVGQLCQIASERARTLYRWDAVAAAYAEVFEVVLEAKRKHVRCAALLGSRDVYRPSEMSSA